MLKDEDNYTREESILVRASELKDDAVGLMYLMPNSYNYIFTPTPDELLNYTYLGIKLLLTIGAVPVFGEKNGAFLWHPTTKYGTDIDTIANNIIKEFERSGKKYPDGGDVWFAIPAVYKNTDSPQFIKEYQQLLRDKSGQTIEELTLDIVELLLKGPMSLCDILSKDDGTFTKNMEKFINHVLNAILILADTVKKNGKILVKDTTWGTIPNRIIDNILTEWKKTKCIPNVIFALPKFCKYEGTLDCL